mmetsp:Transcript_78470/g.212404  ORF Transcript_78470/g.212404 Transcript_78470/m.212404 type:complete len:253 (+) Transcript_78470:368-1126(+)
MLVKQPAAPVLQLQEEGAIIADLYLLHLEGLLCVQLVARLLPVNVGPTADPDGGPVLWLVHPGLVQQPPAHDGPVGDLVEHPAPVIHEPQSKHLTVGQQDLGHFEPVARAYDLARLLPIEGGLLADAHGLPVLRVVDPALVHWLAEPVAHLVASLAVQHPPSAVRELQEVAVDVIDLLHRHSSFDVLELVLHFGCSLLAHLEDLARLQPVAGVWGVDARPLEGDDGVAVRRLEDPLRDGFVLALLRINRPLR